MDTKEVNIYVKKDTLKFIFFCGIKNIKTQ